MNRLLFITVLVSAICITQPHKQCKFTPTISRFVSKAVRTLIQDEESKKSIIGCQKAFFMGDASNCVEGTIKVPLAEECEKIPEVPEFSEIVQENCLKENEDKFIEVFSNYFGSADKFCRGLPKDGNILLENLEPFMKLKTEEELGQYLNKFCAEYSDICQESTPIQNKLKLILLDGVGSSLSDPINKLLDGSVLKKSNYSIFELDELLEKLIEDLFGTNPVTDAVIKCVLQVYSVVKSKVIKFLSSHFDLSLLSNVLGKVL